MTPVVLLWSLLGAGPPSLPVDFNLRDAVGRSHRLADLRGSKAVVVVFVSVDCPLARLYAPRLAEMAKGQGPRGVAFVAVASRHDSPRDAAHYAREHGLPFPVLRDACGIAARCFGAVRSPEAFVLDGTGRVRYRGRIDDQYAVGSRKQAATAHELLDAIEAVLAGGQVAVTSTAAPGCPLPVADRVPLASGATYCRDVAPILQRRCQACHRPGQSGPFSLMTHANTSDWAEAIREVVEAGRMPPWGAAPGHGQFANDPSLTPEEKRTLLAWIEAGCPEGDRKDMPAPRAFPEGWSIPTPDLVVEMPRAFTVPAQGTIEYQYFRVDPGFREDRWVRAAEIRPSNPAVVHHVNIFLQPPGVESDQEMAELGDLGSICLTMVMQGTKPMILRDGLAKRIPAGWRIVFVVHYQAIGSVQEDRTKLGLVFAEPKTVRKEVATKLLYDPALRIPPREANHRVAKEWKFDRDMNLLALVPHMHLRGKSFRYELIRPDGTEEILLDVPQFDFGWQHRYELAEPLLVRNGSRLRCSAVYDNSADNPANPDPDKEVLAGSQTWDEMFNAYFDVCLADEDLTRARTPRAPWVAVALCVAALLILACRRSAEQKSDPRSNTDEHGPEMDRK